MYYRDAEVGLLVYDITVPSTFEALNSWVQGTPGQPIGPRRRPYSMLTAHGFRCSAPECIAELQRVQPGRTGS